MASVGTLSGPGGAVLGPIVGGTQVWVKWVNRTGGLNGHPVHLITYDDAGDPSRHRAQVQEAVEQAHAVAFLTNVETLTGAGSADYITQKHIPVIGTDTATPWATGARCTSRRRRSGMPPASASSPASPSRCPGREDQARHHRLRRVTVLRGL